MSARYSGGATLRLIVVLSLVVVVLVRVISYITTSWRGGLEGLPLNFITAIGLVNIFPWRFRETGRAKEPREPGTDPTDNLAN